MTLHRNSLGALLVALCICPTAFASDTSSRPTPSVYVVSPESNAVVIERGGKTYVVDLDSRTVHEASGEERAQQVPSASASADQSSSKASSAEQSQQTSPDADATVPYYRNGDDRLVMIPTGQRLQKHGMTVNFTHRFAYTPAFKGVAKGNTLAGLDDVAIASFGFKYGITNRLAVSAFRSPSVIARPIELMASYLVSEERTGAPLNAMIRFSVDGQNDFSRNFTTNFEVILSRSITSHAALYLVPTVSLHNRPLIGYGLSAPSYQPCQQALANDLPASFNVRPCANTFSLGVGLAVDIRPTVALIVDANPTLANARELGIHRVPFSFGIQKKIFRHAFTFGFSTAPGVTVAQRAGSRATFRRDPHADTPSGLFIGFNLSRQLR